MTIDEKICSNTYKLVESNEMQKFSIILQRITQNFELINRGHSTIMLHEISIFSYFPALTYTHILP